MIPIPSEEYCNKYSTKTIEELYQEAGLIFKEQTAHEKFLDSIDGEEAFFNIHGYYCQ
jgi:hypothetical protein